MRYTVGDGVALLNAALRGAVAAAAIGFAGAWSGPQVLVLALVGGITFFDLGRRDRVERAVRATRDEDRYGNAMQLAFLALLCAATWDNRSPAMAWRHPDLVTAFGLVLFVAGTRLRQRAARALGRHFTVALAMLDDHELITTGPYRWLRHPNYAGLFLIALGIAMLMASPRAALVAVVVWLPLALLRIRHEERVLEQHLGARWTTYARHRWCICPGLY